MPIIPTVASPPTTAETAALLLSYQFGQSGVVSDANPGSQVRTLSESWGQVAELEGVSAFALTIQAMAYGCLAAFGIIPLPATQAQGVVTFSTGPSDPPPATQDVIIASGTVVQTTAGVQYQTTETVTLAQGTTSITATAEAIIAGVTGNTSTGTIVSIVSGIPYPLYVNNAAAFTGGTNAETIGQTLNRFTAYVQSLGLSSPVAIANAAIGVQAPNSTETVLYSTLYEPWIVNIANGAQWTVYIDNGAGTASTALINAVIAKFSGVYPTANGYRDAGVPFYVMAVTPTPFSVVVAGTLVNPAQDATLDAAVNAAVQTYANGLQFGQEIQASQLNAVVGATLDGSASSFVVELLDGSSNPQTVISVPAISRAQLTSVTTELA